MSRFTSKHGFARKIDGKSQIKCIYIFTEGTETEVNYLESKRREIRSNTISLEIKGKGFNTLSLVDFACDFIKNKRLKLSNDPKSDKCWVVFDRDSFEKCDFDNAISRAEANGIDVAYSNESFEFWFLLHFNYCTSALNRKEINKKLNDILEKKYGIKYNKNLKTMYSYICKFESEAIRNAERLLSKVHLKTKLCSDKNPSTTVHLLVESLNNLKK